LGARAAVNIYRAAARVPAGGPAVAATSRDAAAAVAAVTPDPGTGCRNLNVSVQSELHVYV
jgi:hypothetical protein